ncbi:MAG: PDZ domain-containing protein [Deltaproteobacteria bacterium]|nr:PDZ domain-containing protein [Deltaproteobacteria bacterium]
MNRVVVWALNGALFVLCCLLTASLVNGWVGEWLSATPAGPPPALAAPAAARRDWSDRKTILDRNLFQVSTLLPDEPVAAEPIGEDEELAATRLPLKLLGTVASNDPKAAWAAVEETTKRERLVVRPQDRLLDKATVVRIERRRIVLENEGRREELALDEESAGAGPLVRARAAAREVPAVADLRDRIQQTGDSSFQVQRGQVEEAMRNPAELFSQARILPKYENGQMTGVQLNSIQPGSLFEEIGIRDGDVITEVNGIVVSSPQDSAALLRELTESNVFEVSVQGADGQPRTLSYTVQP